MQANGNHVKSPQNTKPKRVMGGMDGNPYTRIHFDPRTKPQFAWPPPANPLPQVPRKASVNRPPPPPCRKKFIDRINAAAEAKRRSARCARGVRKETKPTPASKEKGIFGIFDMLANFVPWVAPPSDGPLSDSSPPTRTGSFSTAPGAYPSSFVSPPSSTPDLSPASSGVLPSSSLPSSPSSMATTLSDMFMESLVLDATDSFMEAAAENEKEIRDYHYEEMRRTNEYQKALNEEREKVKRASEWAATKEFKERQRRQAEESRRFHALPEHEKEAARRKRQAELERLAELFEAEEKRTRQRTKPANYINLEQREAMLKNEKAVRKQMQDTKRRRDEERRKNAARRAEEAAKAESEKARAQAAAAAAQDAQDKETRKQAERDAAYERAQEAQRKRDAAEAEENERRRVREEEAARAQEEADRWARGDDLLSYIKHLKRDIEGMREGKPLPETLAGGYRLLDRPSAFTRRPAPTTPKAETKRTGYRRVNSGFPRPRHLRMPFGAHTNPRAHRSRQFLFQHSEPKPAPVKEDPLQVRFSQYERIWGALSNPSPTMDLTLTFATMPWPLLAPPSSPANITLAAITAFLFHAQRPDPSPSSEKSRRARLKEELLRWHPDKFEHRVLSHVVLADREAVLAGADAVIKVLNELRSAE